MNNYYLPLSLSRSRLANYTRIIIVGSYIKCADQASHVSLFWKEAIAVITIRGPVDGGDKPAITSNEAALKLNSLTYTTTIYIIRGCA